MYVDCRVPYTTADGVSWFFPTLYNWRRFCLPCTSEDTIKWVKSINPVQLKTISDIAYPLQLKTIQKYAINPVQLKMDWLYTGIQAPPIKSINPVQLKTIWKDNPKWYAQLKTVHGPQYIKQCGLSVSTVWFANKVAICQAYVPMNFELSFFVLYRKKDSY